MKCVLCAAWEQCPANPENDSPFADPDILPEDAVRAALGVGFNLGRLQNAPLCVDHAAKHDAAAAFLNKQAAAH